MFSSVFKLAIEFGLIDAASHGLMAIRDNVLGIAKANEQVRKSYDSAVKSAKITAMSAIATKELAGHVIEATRHSADFQESLLGVRMELAGQSKSVLELTANMSLLRSAAISVKATSPFDIGLIVDAEKAFIKAGASIDAIRAKGGALQASTAAAEYLKLLPEQTAGVLTHVATPFKISAKNYMPLADSFTRAYAAAGLSDTESLDAIIKAAAPKFAEMHKSPEELFAASALLAKANIPRAGMGLKAFMGVLAKNKEFKDAKGELKSLYEIIDITNKKLEGLGGGDRQAKLDKIFGAGSGVAAAMLGDFGETLDEIHGRMKTQIFLQEKVEEGMKGWNKQAELFKSNAGTALAQAFMPALNTVTPLVSEVNKLAAAMNDVLDKKQNVSKAISGLSGGALATGTALTIGAGAFTAYKVLKTIKDAGGAKKMAQVMLGKGGSLATSVAEGAVLQATAGVTPVFITNWPDGFGIGGIKEMGDLPGKNPGKLAPWLIAGARASIIAAPFVLGAAYYNNVKDKPTGHLADIPSMDRFHAQNVMGIFRHYNNESAFLDLNKKIENKMNIMVHVDKDGGSRVISEGNMQTSVKVNRGSFRTN